jgi:hypothetical protein
VRGVELQIFRQARTTPGAAREQVSHHRVRCWCRRGETAYMWDSMDEQDREETIDSLKQTHKQMGNMEDKDKWSTLYRQRAFTKSSTSTKTLKTPVGDSRFKDGDGQETFGSRSPRKPCARGCTGFNHNGTPCAQSQLRQRRRRGGPDRT